MLDIKKIKQHKKYRNEYFLINNEVYSKEELMLYFSIEQDALENVEELKQKPIKPYRYKSIKKLDQQIKEKQTQLFKELNLKKAKSIYENLKITQTLVKHFIEKTSYNSMITEDRLFSLNNKMFELKQNQKTLQKAYEKQVYNKEAEFKKTKKLLKQIEKQTKAQNTKLLFDSLVKNQTTNTNDGYTIMYLLNKLNIEAYLLTLKHKKNNNTYTLILIASKKNNYETIKYYATDITKTRREIKTVKKEDSKIKLFGKNTLQSEYDNYNLIRLENLQKVFLPTSKEWDKTINQISKETLEFNF